MLLTLLISCSTFVPSLISITSRVAVSCGAGALAAASLVAFGCDSFAGSFDRCAVVLVLVVLGGVRVRPRGLRVLAGAGVAAGAFVLALFSAGAGAGLRAGVVRCAAGVRVRRAGLVFVVVLLVEVVGRGGSAGVGAGAGGSGSSMRAPTALTRCVPRLAIGVVCLAVSGSGCVSALARLGAG